MINIRLKVCFWYLEIRGYDEIECLIFIHKRRREKFFRDTKIILHRKSFCFRIKQDRDLLNLRKKENAQERMNDWYVEKVGGKIRVMRQVTAKPLTRNRKYKGALEFEEKTVKREF